jgi:hypothetical protein
MAAIPKHALRIGDEAEPEHPLTQIAFGCTDVQGFLIGRPIAPEQVRPLSRSKGEAHLTQLPRSKGCVAIAE